MVTRASEMLARDNVRAAPRLYVFIMSFGRNPHVAKAEAAEQKARSARDSTACEHAWREAGQQWERAAERETDHKRRDQYIANAEIARTTADKSRAGSD
jgi:hypothetical protein